LHDQSNSSGVKVTVNMFIYDIMNDVITKNIKYEQYIDFLSSPDPISGVYILQE